MDARTRRIGGGVVGLLCLFLLAQIAPGFAGGLLITFSVVAFLWAVVGLIRPQWGKLPTRGAAVWVWALSVGLFVAGGVVLAPPEEQTTASDAPVNAETQRVVDAMARDRAERETDRQTSIDRAQAEREPATRVWAPRNPNVVEARTWVDGPWPLTFSGGVLTCAYAGDNEAVFIVDNDGTMWPLNGVAQANHSRWGAEPSIDPVWRADSDIPGTKIGIGPLIAHARRVACS